MKTPIYTGLAQSDLDIAGFKIIGLHAPSSATDAANKAYVDAHGGGGGGSGSENVVYLSSSVTSDATDIGYGATAPSGTDVTSDVQTVVNSVPSGGILVWDVAVGLSAPILIPSYITIMAPSRKFGAILRAAANCPMFRNVGITTDATTSKQKTFGQLDSGHAGNAAYRLLETGTYINDRCITIRGGTWNGNRSQQTGYPFTATYGFLSTFQFWGVEDVVLDGLYILDVKAAVPVHFCNWHKVTIRNCEFDGSPIATTVGGVNTSAAFQFNGPGRTARIEDIVTHASDDHVAFNVDDSNATAINNAYAGSTSVCTPGVNWVQCGDITDVRVTGHRISNGIENTSSIGCVRLLSSVHLIDDVIFDGQTGTTSRFAYTLGSIPSLQIDGVGNLGRIDFCNCSVTLTNPANQTGDGVGKAMFDVQGSAQLLRILGRRRGTVPASGVPDVYLGSCSTGAATVTELVLDGDYYDDGTSGNVAVAQILCACAVGRIFARTRSSRAGSVNASPVLLTATGANISIFDFQGDLDLATNIVKHAVGTLTSVTMRGSHRNTSGGSPLDIATGLTVTNGWYTDLAFVAVNQFKSGSGTLTNGNDYYIGTDARLIPVTGGVKIQARNPGTNTWVDADQWTNP